MKRTSAAVRQMAEAFSAKWGSPAERVASACVVDPQTGCWNWTGSLASCGYGGIRVRGKTLKAHRLAYELERGPIPPGLVLDHLCRNRRCVNPYHLEAVTSVENVMRGVGFSVVNAAKQQCVNGHAFDELNTYKRADGRWRGCRACNAAAARRYAARKAQS